MVRGVDTVCGNRLKGRSNFTVFSPNSFCVFPTISWNHERIYNSSKSVLARTPNAHGRGPYCFRLESIAQTMAGRRRRTAKEEKDKEREKSEGGEGERGSVRERHARTANKEE